MRPLSRKVVDLTPSGRESVLNRHLGMFMPWVIGGRMINNDVLMRRYSQPNFDLKPDAMTMLGAAPTELKRRSIPQVGNRRRNWSDRARSRRRVRRSVISRRDPGHGHPEIDRDVQRQVWTSRSLCRPSERADPRHNETSREDGEQEKQLLNGRSGDIPKPLVVCAPCALGRKNRPKDRRFVPMKS